MLVRLKAELFENQWFCKHVGVPGGGIGGELAGVLGMDLGADPNPNMSKTIGFLNK